MISKTVLRWGMGLLLGTAVGLLLLIAAGTFDPQPLGTSTPLAAPGTLTLAPDSREIRWTDCSLPAADYTIRATGTTPDHASFRYGLALGAPQDYVAVLVSPAGYVTLRHQEHSLLPLQTWPHVRPDANEIWLNVTAKDLTVRINGERLWQGELKVPGQKVGIMGETRNQPGTVSFTALACPTER